jgi:ribonuclease P protein component
VKSGKNSLKKSERLSSESRIAALFDKGQRGGAGVLRFSVLVGIKSGEGEASKPSAEADGNDFELKPGERVAVLFSVPKKFYKRAWKRNLIKRRMRESYRQRKHSLVAAATLAGARIDMALICSPALTKNPATVSKRKAPTPPPEIPDFKTIDNAIERILEKITARI